MSTISLLDKHTKIFYQTIPNKKNYYEELTIVEKKEIAKKFLTEYEKEYYELSSKPDNNSRKITIDTPAEIEEQILETNFKKLLSDKHFRGQQTCHADEKGIYLLNSSGSKKYIKMQGDEQEK